jgi:hypothetical protein
MSVANLRNLFDSFSNSVMDTLELTWIAVSAMERYRESVELATAVDQYRQASGKGAVSEMDRVERLRRMRRAVPIALAQKDRGCPFLHGLAAVAVWGELEAFVEDYAIEMLLFDDHLWRSETFAKLRAPVVDFMAMSLRERAEWTVQAIQRDMGAGQRNAISLLQSPVESVGLNGQVNELVKRPLIELCAIRNLLVHRRGVADKRFLSLCPWSPIAVGDNACVDGPKLDWYASAAVLFGCELLVQTLKKYGEDASQEDGVIRASKVMLADTQNQLFASQKPVDPGT